ncbi:uncharacterized protein [Nicotiana sylvestris]|uniref:uncharacterized protein n=1 Tax=Nicotiana sylvestris TaxID=4096 RepID=UPI00388CB371
MVLICHRDASALFDPGSTYSYVSSYFALYLDISRDPLSSVYVSMLVGDSIIVEHVYRSCLVIIGGFEASIDLLLLNMVDFDVILGIDWLSAYHVILYCHAKTVTLAMSAFVRDVSANTPTVESVPIVRDFPDVFPADLLGMPPDRYMHSSYFYPTLSYGASRVEGFKGTTARVAL